MRYVIYFHCLLHPEETEWRNGGVLNENIIFMLVLYQSTKFGYNMGT